MKKVENEAVRCRLLPELNKHKVLTVSLPRWYSDELSRVSVDNPYWIPYHARALLQFRKRKTTSRLFLAT
ncbi:hypothetical protein AB1N83_009824 [Pleurotus pulmonarius]